MKKGPSNIDQNGYALVDVLLGAALFVMLITFIVPAYIYGQESLRIAGTRQRAAAYAEEGLEAVRNIRDNSFSDLADGTYGLATSTGEWMLAGISDTDGTFTRQIKIESGSTADRKKITSAVTWNQNQQRPGNISLVTYLDNWARPVSGPISIVGSASNPSDNGSFSGPTAALTPPTGMQTGDVVVVIAAYRGSATLNINNTGGQSWTALGQQNYLLSESARIFYAVYNGSWTSNPSVTNGSGTLGLTAVMHVFRNVDPEVIDTAQVAGTFSAPTGKRDVTIPGIPTINDGALVLAAWTTIDNNTWGIQTSGWSNVGLAQYRNQAGNDSSISTAYKLIPTAGASGSVTNRQLTLGGDAGIRFILALKHKL